VQKYLPPWRFRLDRFLSRGFGDGHQTISGPPPEGQGVIWRAPSLLDADIADDEFDTPAASLHRPHSL